MATILRAYNDENQKFDLDVSNEEAFLLDISAIESGDIGKVFGISSQTFALPSTNNNDAYFGNLYDLGASPATSFIKTLPCQVLSDGQEIFSGTIYLESIVTDNEGDTIYNAVVVNETIDFKYQIEDLTFGDLDWSDYNHELTYGNITASWDLNLFGGDVVYPLAEYGVEENDNDAVLLVNGGGLNTFTNADYPLKPIDFKPAIRVRTLVEKIFDKVNYSYSSSFIDSAYMDSVYVLATQDESRTAGSFASPVSQSFKAWKSSPQTYSPPSFTPAKITFDTEIYDNAGGWDTTQSTFRAQSTGNYSFAVNLPFTITNLNSFVTRAIKLDLAINGTLAPGTTRFYNYNGLGTLPPITTYQGFISDNWNNLTLASGDEVSILLTFTSVAVGEVLEINSGQNTYFTMYQGATSYQGSNVDLGRVFNPEEKITDFLQGIIQKFNLVFEPSFDNQNVINIETFNDWRDAGEIVDWTDKVDRSVKWEIKHPMANNPRDIYFSDEEDKDYFNTYSQDSLAKTFGEYTYFSEADLASGERKIGSYFAPTPMRFIEGTNDFIVPQIYSAKGVGEQKTRLVFKPRLLHYLGKKDNAQLFDLTALFPPYNTALQGVWWLADEFETPYSQSQYPVFHHVSELPATTASLDLHFGNLNHMEYHQDFVNAETEQSAFYTYWAEYVNELYDIDARLVTLNVKLNPNDIPNIKLNDKIFIDGHYYRINKISGANLTNEQSTKVELIKTPLRKIKYPRRRISIGDFGGNDYQDLIVSPAGTQLGGRVEYVDFETGDVITDGNLISQASSRDGFRYFSGSTEAVWVTDRTSIPSSNKTNGVNYIDSRASNVVVNGSGNTISAYASNANIVGQGNFLPESAGNINIYGDNIIISGSVKNAFVVNLTGSATITDTNDVIALNPVRPVNGYDNDKVVIGNSLNQGAQYETYNVEEMYAGRVLYLTGSEVQDRFHYHFTWSGSNGSSIVYVNDSSNPAYDGLLQRFTSDGSLTASNVVNITPISGTIDGGAEEPLTTPYDGMTAQIINGEWQVIQRKK